MAPAYNEKNWTSSARERENYIFFPFRYKAGFTRGENAELLRKRNYKPPLFGHLNPQFVVDLSKEANIIELDLSRVHFVSQIFQKGDLLAQQQTKK